MMTKEWDVLVVEDEPEMNEIIGAYVQLAGFGYRPVLTGRAALQEAKRQRPALIVLDLMLPDMTGFEICQSIKSDPATDSIPVVFLTAMRDEANRHRGRLCGATDYLTKPFDPEKLIDCLRRNVSPEQEMHTTLASTL